jgi:hypothetical protein
MTLLTLSNATVLAAREALSASSSSRGPGHRHRVTVIVIGSPSLVWQGIFYFLFFWGVPAASPSSRPSGDGDSDDAAGSAMTLSSSLPSSMPTLTLMMLLQAYFRQRPPLTLVTLLCACFLVNGAC